jgi:hypothetical protein
MTAVKISGTFSKDSRPDNGLESIAEELAKDEFGRRVVVAVLELHKVVKEPGEAPVPTVRFVAVEPVAGDAEDACIGHLNAARIARGQSGLSGTLFDAAVDDGPEPDEGPVSERPVDAWLDNGEKPDKPKRSRTR